MIRAALELRAAAGYAPDDDFWYRPIGMPSGTGIRIDAPTALKISVAWRCTTLISGAIARVPLHVLERRPDGGKQEAPDHPLARILKRPNAQQNGRDWKLQGENHLLLRGNFYNRIVPGPSIYPIGGLVPIMPDLVQVLQARRGDVSSVRMAEAGPGLVPVYRVRDAIDGTTTNLTSEEVWHVRGLSLDGVRGLDVVSYAKEGMGLALGAEHFGARFYGKGAHPSVVLRHKGQLSSDAQQRLKQNFADLHGGLEGAHGVAVLEEGTELQQLSLTQDQAQFLGTREFQARDVGRWFGVPPHMYGEVTRNTSWGSGVEQMGIGFVVYVLADWASTWEWALDELLIGSGDRLYTKFTLDGLLRGDTAARHAAYRSGLEWEYYTINEVRALEDKNPVAWGDRPIGRRQGAAGGRAQMQAIDPRELATVAGEENGH